MYIRNTQELPAEEDFRLTKVGKKEPGGEYTWETKTTFVTVLLATGNRAEASRQAGVAYETSALWLKQPWYPKLVEEVKRSVRSELNTKMAKIVDKALAATEDRIENGDYILNNKTGELLRRPVALREVAKVANDMMSQQVKLEKLNNETTVQNETMQELLTQLGKEFAKFNSTIKKNNAETIAFKDK